MDRLGAGDAKARKTWDGWQDFTVRWIGQAWENLRKHPGLPAKAQSNLQRNREDQARWESQRQAATERQATPERLATGRTCVGCRNRGKLLEENSDTGRAATLAPLTVERRG